MDHSAGMNFPEPSPGVVGATKRQTKQSKKGRNCRFNTREKYASLSEPTCCEISMIRIFFWASCSSVWCAMQYLKHSTTHVTMTALSDGLFAARSLDRLRQTKKKNTF